jgi:hypothetical protein
MIQLMVSTHFHMFTHKSRCFRKMIRCQSAAHPFHCWSLNFLPSLPQGPFQQWIFRREVGQWPQRERCFRWGQYWWVDRYVCAAFWGNQEFMRWMEEPWAGSWCWLKCSSTDSAWRSWFLSSKTCKSKHSHSTINFGNCWQCVKNWLENVYIHLMVGENRVSQFVDHYNPQHIRGID